MEISYYDQTAFESDMNQEGLLPERPLESFAAETLKSGDVVISMPYNWRQLSVKQMPERYHH